MSNPSEIRISVALVTRNRPESLERTLRSLRAQNVQPFEVVVSDDSDDTHAPAIRRLSETYGCRYLEGRRQGLYTNRNHVALACVGTHIRSMDDDHEFPPGHFEACLRAVRAEPDTVWIIGEHYPEDESKDTVPPCPGQLNAGGYSSPSLDPPNCWALSDGATIYPHAIFFERNLRFVDDFKFGASYLEFGCRLHALGIPIRYLKDTYILHHLDMNNRSFNDSFIDLASQIFAGLCYSHIYQRTLPHRLTTYLKIAQLTARYRGVALRAARAGWSSYKRQRANFYGAIRS